jgi:hypothetical protein
MSKRKPIPGWDAIDRACDTLYRGREPLHVGTIVRYSQGGPDPLDGISAYKNLQPVCHWHFVTYGLSELYKKTSDDPAVSGYGFELTFRLACDPDDARPPWWPMNFLQNLARYVFETGNTFASGHHLDLNGPIALGMETDIRAAVFTADPQLGEIDTPHGRLTFLQVVGVTRDELNAAREWNSQGFLEILSQKVPLLVTDLSRRSLLADPDTAAAVRRRADEEGSSVAELRVDVAEWCVREKDGVRDAALTLGALAVPGVLRLLHGRIRHGRDCWLRGPEQSVRFVPSEAAGWNVEDDVLVIEVSPGLAGQMQGTLAARRGTYRWPELPGLELTVLATEIKDEDDNVTEVIG